MNHKFAAIKDIMEKKECPNIIIESNWTSFTYESLKNESKLTV